MPEQRPLIKNKGQPIRTFHRKDESHVGCLCFRSRGWKGAGAALCTVHNPDCAKKQTIANHVSSLQFRLLLRVDGIWYDYCVRMAFGYGNACQTCGGDGSKTAFVPVRGREKVPKRRDSALRGSFSTRALRRLQKYISESLLAGLRTGSASQKMIAQ